MKILVVGDSCKDVFVYGDITRLTPEAPVPVFNPLRTTENDGMARNVSNNVEALDVGIHTITNPNSIKKVRYVDDKSNQLVLRVDEHDYCDRIDDMILTMIQGNECYIPMTGKVKVDAIIVSDDVPVKDISGAGDTFLAGLVVKYIQTNDIIESILFAQDCTKIVVQKHGVSTI